MASSTLREVVAREQAGAARLSQLLDPIAAELVRVEDALSEQVQGFDGELHRHVQYVLGSAGKRLRPSLALLAGGATGMVREEHITLGVIVELIHMATLVHDDVLDEAQLRHGVPTTNSRWGNEISVLLGDCLFAHALRLAAGYPTTAVCRRVSEATNTVCAGELLQTQRRFDLELSVAEYLKIIERKTGALFAVSCELGGSLNGAAPAVVKELQEFGTNLGIAYQIYDDCVDLFGQERKAGKSLGTDVKKGKLTLPFLLLLGAAGRDKRQKLGALMFGDEPRELQGLLSLATGNGAVSVSLATIDRYIARAQSNLEGLPANTYTKTLFGLLDYLAAQSRSLLRGD